MHDLRLVVAFAFHTVLAVVLFALIGGAAALLDFYTRFLGRVGIPWAIQETIKFMEYFLFAVDLVCLVVYVSREAFLLLRAMVSPEHDAAHRKQAPGQALLAGPDDAVHPGHLL